MSWHEVDRRALVVDPELAGYLAIGLGLLIDEFRHGLPVPRALIGLRDAASRIAGTDSEIRSGAGPISGPIAPDTAGWWGTGTTADRLGVTDRQVRRLCAAGRLRAVDGAGQNWLIDPASVETYRRTNRMGDRTDRHEEGGA